MIKWLFILAIALGAAWHFNGKKNSPSPVIEVPQASTGTPAQEVVTPTPAQASREPSEEQCRAMGGRIMSGMGCVVGAPAGNTNPSVSPSEMESYCQSSGKRYVRDLNACVSS